MTTTELKTTLAHLGRIDTNEWRVMRALVDGIVEGRFTVQSKEWGDPFKRNNPGYYSLDLAKLETWSTYTSGECIDLLFELEGEQLTCRARIYDGDNYDGHRKGLRFNAIITLPDSFFSALAHNLERAFTRDAEQAYEQHLREVQNRWMRKYKTGILATGKSLVVNE